MPDKVEYRYATAEDLKAYYKDDPVYYSSRAVVIVKDGEVVGVGGVSRVMNKMLVFVDLREDRVTKRDVIMAGRLLLKIINRYTSVIAYMDDELETAERFSAHYGFLKTGIVTDEGPILMRVNR